MSDVRPESGPLRHLTRAAVPSRIELLAAPSLADDDAAQVMDYLLGKRSTRRILDGSRSVVIPSRASGVHGGIKIKGAGYEGAGIRMGTLHTKPYPLPRYDAEGAATIDAAKDHGRAYAGGMSYQQARHEFIMSHYLGQRGMHVFAPLGYGVLRRGEFASWFCLLDMPPHPVTEWWQMSSRPADVERFAAAFGTTQHELARHDVYLTLSGLLEFEDQFIRKDFHTAHLAGTNDSWLTRLSYFLFDVNFILAQFVTDEQMAKSRGLQQLARSTYLRSLTGHDYALATIDRFKELLVELKYADWPMERRIARLADDAIGRTILESHLAASGERQLFGELPAASPEADAADAVPVTTPPPRGLARFFRRR